MKEHYDFSNGRKNPHATAMKERGYSVTTHYSPQDIANGQLDDTKDIIQALVDVMSADDLKRLLLHIRENYDLPHSTQWWDIVVEGCLTVADNGTVSE